jgi:hypothetical protein
MRALAVWLWLSSLVLFALIAAGAMVRLGLDWPIELLVEATQSDAARWLILAMVVSAPVGWIIAAIGMSGRARTIALAVACAVAAVLLVLALAVRNG